MKQKTKSFIGVALAGTLLLVTSTFNIVPFPIFNTDSGNYGRPCYSPNQEYYIERYTTLPKALIIIPSRSKSGFAILYDKSGKEIYRGAAHDIYKPGWFGDHVIFFGRWGSGGYGGAKLPSSAGEEFIGCFTPGSNS